MGGSYLAVVEGWWPVERAIKDLCQLSDAKLLDEIAVGIGHVVDVVAELDLATKKLHESGHFHPARVLGGLANEEAAKVLILVDAVRCPRKKQKEMSRTLGCFYDHLAKGIYADSCAWRPVNFAKVTRHVSYDRQEFYLDGPNGVDWIFPNAITRRREDELYVGYVRGDTEEDEQSECYWAAPPAERPLDAVFSYRASAVIDLVRALHQAGVTTSNGLSIVAEIWRPIDVRPEMRFSELERLNWRTLEIMEERGILQAASKHDYSIIHRGWGFPLWPLDLRVQKVDKARLREAQRNWSPEAY